MAETSIANCGFYLKDAPIINYEISTAFGYIKRLVFDLTKVIDGPIDDAPGTGTMSGLPYADEIFLNSAMSIFNNMYDIRGNFAGCKAVREFLQCNTFLIPLVSEAYERLQTHFPYSTIFMDVVHDELVISVGTTLSPKETRKNLNAFDEEWWLDVCVNSHAKLCITVEFQ
jgi:hypothetical protein